MSFSSSYDHKAARLKWTAWWQENAVYHWDENEERSESFVIDTPPPTVSGLLHMGHVFSYTQTDFKARFERMRGKNVFYPIGFDDNGLATERLVEKVRGIRAVQMSREEFRRTCADVVKESEAEFRELFKTLALSVDWRQEYQTVSQSTIKISQMSFLDLVAKGFCERKLAPTFWDVVDQTAIAQAEIEDKEKQGVMYDIAFHTESGEELVIATTRPELLAGCVALMYHPDDGRYSRLSGMDAIVPIFGFSVPIIQDHDVDMEKGTGLVMCCTFGDITDIEWWRRHNLEIKQVVDQYGKLIESGKFSGMKLKDAKKAIVEELEELKLVYGRKEITQFVKCAERSGAELEIIPTYQWYINLLDKKEALLAKGRECNWHPEYMRVRYENWVSGLNQDWCISRQRYFGVMFPVWYSKRPGEEGKILMADLGQLPCDPTVDLPIGYEKDEVIPETDVMDTWATSALTPQINAGGINENLSSDPKRFAKLYPADLRPQAHEIIRTWSFYTIAKSLLHMSQKPWSDLMISGWCLASDKTKMSKSKGNVVTPKELIEEKGVDVVRYWASNSKLGVDIVYSEEVFKSGQRLVNKLWNACKFAGMHIASLGDARPSDAKSDVEAGLIHEDLDLWLLSKLRNVVVSVTQEFENYDYAEARMVTEAFFWNDLCDNYLEIAKVRLYNEIDQDDKARESAVRTLWHVVKVILRLFAPFIPYVTEEINSIMFESGVSLHRRGQWPEAGLLPYSEDKLSSGEKALMIVELVRKYKSEHSLSLRTSLERILVSSQIQLSGSLLKDIKNASCAHEVEVVEDLGEREGYLRMEKNEISCLIKISAQ